MDNSQTPWYAEWFDRDEYQTVYRHRDEVEADLLIETVKNVIQPAPGDRILDVGCGRGRHAIALARDGLQVTGIDLSVRSIEAARRRAAEEGVSATFIIGDMRDVVCENCFSGAMNLFTAFGYFENEADHQTVVDAIGAAVQPGGWFVQDFLNPDYVRANLVAEDRRTEDGLDIVQRREIKDGRIVKTIDVSRDDVTHQFCESVRLFRLDELERLHRSAGFLVEHVFGDYGGGPYKPSSSRTIVVSRLQDQ